MNPIRIIIHNSADSYKGDQLEKINAYHKSKDFPLSSKNFYVGYHYLIEWSGKVIQTREDTEIGAHCKGLNQDSLGICLAMDGNKERYSFAQSIALKNLVNEKMKQYTILPANIAGHRMFRETECPGEKITEQELRNLFIPDLSYYQKLLNSLKELLDKLLKKSMPLGYEKDDICNICDTCNCDTYDKRSQFDYDE